jgi:hypothetical protein
MVLEAYPGYFLRHWEQSRQGTYVVGNSDNAVLPWLPGLWLLWPDLKILLSVRNGIQTVQSIYLNHARPNPAALDERNLRPAYRDASDEFEGVCRRWVEQIDALERSRAWLCERGADVYDTSLEQVTSDPSELERIWTWLIGDWPAYAERNLALRSERVNARTSEARIVDWDEIWANWTRDRQTTFTRICGETQMRLGYPLPGNEGRRNRSRLRPQARRATIDH